MVIPQNETAIFYRISKNQKPLGYLLGSFHMYLNPIDYENKKNYFIPFLKKCDTLFLETNLPHYTQLTMGIERALLNGIAQEELALELNHFDNMTFLQTMISDRIWLGTKIVTLPWHRYEYIKAHPLFFFYLNKVIMYPAFIYNIIYNMFTGSAHSFAVQAWQQERSDMVLHIFKKYQEQKIATLSKEDENSVFMLERNLDYLEQLLAHFSEENLLFCTIGAAHLPGEHGLVYLLSKEGYELTPIDQTETQSAA